MEKGIQKLFSEVAHRYELTNHVLTLGRDIAWRKKAVGLAAGAGGRRWLDVCTGTGETAALLCRSTGVGTTVVAVDFSLPMLLGAVRKKEASRILPAIADAGVLPFPNSTFDLITISFATRNLNTSRRALENCFREFHRVLVPGGRFVNLETSQPASGLFRALVHLYVGLLVRPVGEFLSGSRAGYSYLSATIPRFYTAGELSEILKSAGFPRVTSHRLLGGVAAVHVAVKGDRSGGSPLA
jgi:demethylmenaquinone methyltransferase/2-methoxy-6-polyprenyl-1,4-benzoquinol methylase